MEITAQFFKEPDKKAKSLIRKITHSGETDLDKQSLHELKGICKNCKDDLMAIVYKECMKCLHKRHSQVRVATVKLLDYLFQKSHIIREKLLYDFNLFIELALAITQKPKVKLQLPPPKKYAALLQELAAKVIHKWYADFGTGYEKLRYAHRYLSEHRLVDFSHFQVNTHEQLIQQQKLAERQEKILTRSIENRLKELRELKPDIEQLLAQIESLIDILVPTESNFLNDSLVCNDSEKDEQTISNHQQHGIANLSQTIEIEFSPYVEIRNSRDNREIVQNLKELKQELTCGKLVKLIAIEKTLIKRSDQLVNTLREIIDLKTRSTNLVVKLGELKIINDCFVEKDRTKDASTLDKVNIESSSDDDNNEDFQDVQPKDDLESYIPKSMRYEYGLEPINPRELEDARCMKLVGKSFDGDLLPSSSSKSAELNLTIPCNVRLESGKLCPRQDKIKCPFHGKIIPRDHNGIPLDENDRIREEELARKQPRVPEWQDPELLAEIKAATGVDLTMPIKGRTRGSPKKNLANTKTCDTTPQQRLRKRLKLFNK